MAHHLRKGKVGPVLRWTTVHGKGFAYLALLILLAIIGIASAATLQLGSLMQKRDAEDQLLIIGNEFRNALISYAAATPSGNSIAPPDLQALLKDNRFPNPKRHLRKLYNDPVTGKPEWGVVLTIDGKGVQGVHSLSTARPIKIGNFSPEFQGFEDKNSYADWVFSAINPSKAPITSQN
ncbi:type II secretion system protein [Undibacterium terreum]|uniref:Type II secretion system pseudopilin TklG n=1 Tax=Undibacterium terreum TaxID=1224302 RepID=A0A916UTP6_9BURK|nr:type II secretion system protein [Undibacterium terreum]GGC87732.1 type II secretion system pseudopilin TklG [Undibacterium terreum]